MSATTATSITTSVTPLGQPQEQPPEELPKPSNTAVEFLDTIDEIDFKNLLFADELVTVSDTGKELGEFKVSIQETKYAGVSEEVFLVHANSHGAIDNVPCGTSITAYVSKQLETLEQQHHEYVKLENHPLDRKTFIMKQEASYVVNRVVTQGPDVQRTAQTFHLNNMRGFVSEGSNLILQRLFIRKGLPDNCTLIAFDSDSNLCPVVYKPLDARVQVVQETELDVTGIERTITSLTDLPTSWQSYFTPEGYLTSRVQVGSPVTMRVVTVPVLVEEEEHTEKPTFGKTDLNWEEDAEMYSKFLDRKAELKEGHASYMRRHPELQALISDYLQFLLLHKPSDVIEFAADYFSSFSPVMPSNTAYLDSAAPSPFPDSRSNSKIQYLTKSP